MRVRYTTSFEASCADERGATNKVVKTPGENVTVAVPEQFEWGLP
jgi:hypothetical protein